MALLFNRENLKVRKAEPMSRFERYFGNVIVEIIILALIVVAFWRMLCALRVF
jgi:hypothetical protein